MARITLSGIPLPAARGASAAGAGAGTGAGGGASAAVSTGEGSGLATGSAGGGTDSAGGTASRSLSTQSMMGVSFASRSGAPRGLTSSGSSQTHLSLSIIDALNHSRDLVAYYLSAELALEVSRGQLRIGFERFAPTAAGLVFLTQSLQGMAE